MDHVCFHVQPWDTEVIEQQLQQYDINISATGNRYGAFGMGPSIYLHDPEGNTIELKGATQ